MIRNLLKRRLLLSGLAVLALTLSGLADTIRLKDGSIIKGTIVSFAEGRFVIVVGEGLRRRELTLSAEEVASIVFEPKASDTTAKRQSSGDSKIVPVSTKPKVVVNENAPEEESPNAKNPPKVVVTDSNGTQTTQSSSTAKNPAPTRTDEPIPSKPATKANNLPSQPNRTSTAAPISLNVRVLADNTANGWTNSGWVVKKGQRIRVTASGSVSLGKGHKSTPSGLPDLDDGDKLLKGVPTGALLAVIGDDNNDFIYVGGSREFTAARDGALYLGVNEGNLNDNSGSYEVKIEILPVSED